MKKNTCISAVLIVKNEALMIQDCLESVKWADEIVVLDSGSTDDTLKIAGNYTDKIFTNTKWEGFGKQRRKAQEFAECDWIFMIDADERVTDELRASILSALSDSPGNTVFSVDRLSWCFGRFIRHCGWYPDRIFRLYPKNIARYDDALVHEKLKYPDDVKIQSLKGDLIHYPYRDMRHYLEKSAEYAQAWAVERFSKGKKAGLWTGIYHAVGCFLKMYILRLGFLDGKQGFLLSLLSSHSTFVKYADLWFRNFQKNHNLS